MFIEEGEYKGNPMLIIKDSEDDKYPFSFGFKKAKKIVNAITEIKNFVLKYEEKNEYTSPSLPERYAGGGKENEDAPF